MRLDLYLAEKGYAASRALAKRLIESGAVTVDGDTVKKPATDVGGDSLITVCQPEFVGRGGEKLSAALRLFRVDVKGLRALDIGASTGGFTDCLLQNGAAHVVAVDAGSGQLHESLCRDPRVTNIEKYNARYLKREDVGIAELAVMDVSFISQTYILPVIPTVLVEGGLLISLIKPQFEAGRGALDKHGLVKKDKDRIFAVSRVLAAAGSAHLRCEGLAPSPIKGGEGNEEYLALFRHDPTCTENAGVTIENTVIKKAVIT